MATSKPLREVAVKFTDVTMTKSQMMKIEPELRGALIASTIASNEIRMMWRLLLLCSYEHEGHDVAQIVVGSNYLSLARRLSASVVEFWDMIGTVCDALKSKPDMTEMEKYLRENKANSTYNAHFQISERMRNKSTNHYDAAELDILTKSFEDGHQFSAYLHRVGGNSCFAFAEEIAVVGEFNQDRSKHTNLDAWLEWIRTSSESAAQVHMTLFREVLARYIPELAGNKRSIPMDRRMVCSDADKLPLVYFKTADEPK